MTEKLQSAFKKLTGKGKLSENDVKEAMRDVRMALLEADVNYAVVKEFVNKVTEKAIGQGVLESLTPGQQVIKIVNEQLIELMGSSQSKIKWASAPPTVIMMVGLQGSGKTTTSAKLAGYLAKQGKNPLLVACDIYRPAAVKQLQIVGQKVNIPVFSLEAADPVAISRQGLEYAKKHSNDVVILDTAGRLHIDDEMMLELENIKASVHPDEILLVVDAMTGQDAVNVAKNFNERLVIDGVVLTKLDGDTRGGAALSVKAVTGKPIKFVGMGEKLDDLEPFHPDRIASRILGMGDVLTLIEKAQAAVDEKKAMELENKLRNQQFTLEDFLDQLHEIKKMGPLSQIMDMLPGINSKKMGNVQVDDKELGRIEAIINSMTKQERLEPAIINGSRRRRIAKGSGTTIQEVNRLLKQFEETKRLMRQFTSMEKSGRRGMLKLPF
ncbi:signal recognition particle protein [Mahella sp.]|uniref:signal recognition particle protein n=1 Tax=Mahella sp. TaxID=2798721 RepID=UPI0025C008FC|nr:signal recognition particle protein [Mahella sp.]MBZ4664981.1 signal recognition particle subunit (srp54) [Mahella sp.]